MHVPAQRAGRMGVCLAGELPPDDFDPEAEPPEPSELEPSPLEPSDWEPLEIPCTDDDSNWDVFLPDDDEQDPVPDTRDFWIDTSQEDRAESPSGI